MLNRLKTREVLQARNLNIVGGCLFCHQSVESSNHLFFQCPFPATVWRGVLAKVGIRRIPKQWSTELNWIRKKATGRSQNARLLRSLLAATIYQLWSERNARLFHHGASAQEEICNKILYHVRLLN